MNARKPREIVAAVSGIYDGEEFTTKLTFHRIDPDKSEQHYGSGEYVRVTVDGRSDLTQLLDNRYARKKLEDVATSYIESYFGSNAREYSLHFIYDKKKEVQHGD